MAVTADTGRYRPLRTLGAGGMGRVDLAEDTRLGRRVALKRISDPQDASVVLRLRREALVGASLSHPNLVSIYDIATSRDGHPVIVMEYVEGENLSRTLARLGRLGATETCRILDGVAAALDAIHERGIVHRDVKPSNILLGPEGMVKLADLGIAAAVDATRITTSGSVIGSASYMSPEQIESRSLTPASDIYALGAVAYELLCGRRAWSGTNPVALVHAICTQPPPDLVSAWPQAPDAAAALLRRAMDRDPLTRPASAGELAGGLRAALLPAPARPRPRRIEPTEAPRGERPPARPAFRARALTAGLLTAIIAAVVVVAALNTGGSASGHHAGTVARRSGARSTVARRSGARSTVARAGTAKHSAPHVSSRPTGAQAGATSAAGAASSPVAAVERFYQLAAARRYPAAWALADPTLRAELDGYSGFQATVADLRAITFDGARLQASSTDAATVAIQTTATLESGTQRCSGTVELVSAGGSPGWLLHRIQIGCS